MGRRSSPRAATGRARRGGGDRGLGRARPGKRKSAYRGVAEGSLYVREDARGTGVGRRLTEAIIDASERAGIWTGAAQGCWIFPENEASIALCESLGFRIVGVRERIGRREGRWRDVVVMERRSGKARPLGRTNPKFSRHPGGR